MSQPNPSPITKKVVGGIVSVFAGAFIYFLYPFLLDQFRKEQPTVSVNPSQIVQVNVSTASGSVVGAPASHLSGSEKQMQASVPIVPPPVAQPHATDFREGQISGDFRSALAENPALATGKGGFRVLELAAKKRMFLLVTSAPVKKPGTAGRAEAEDICEMLALEQLAANDGLLVQARRQLTEGGFSRDVIAKVEAVVRDLPVVGSWLSVDGTQAFVARGIICDADGQAVVGRPAGR